MKALVEQGVAGAAQHQLAALGGQHDQPFDAAAEQDPGLHGIDLGEDIHRPDEVVVRQGKETRDLGQDPLDFALFAGSGGGQPVVELDHRQRLDESRRPTGGNVEQETRKLRAGGGPHRKTVAITAQGRRCIGHHLAVGTSNAFELGRHLGAGAHDLAPQALQLGRRGVRHRAVAVEAGGDRSHQVRGVGELPRDRAQPVIVGGAETPADGRHPSGEVEQSQEITGFGGRRRIVFQPRQRVVDPGKGESLLVLDQLGHRQRHSCCGGWVAAAGRLSAESLDKRAAHAAAGVGRDQLKDLVEFEV